MFPTPESWTHNFSHVNSVTALPCKVQFICWLGVFLPFPWNSGKSTPFALFFNFLKSSSYKIPEQTATSSTKPPNVQTSYHQPTDVFICFHRSFNRFWTWMYSLECQNHRYSLKFSTGNSKDHSRTIWIGHRGISNDQNKIICICNFWNRSSKEHYIHP